MGSEEYDCYMRANVDMIDIFEGRLLFQSVIEDMKI